MMAAQSLQPMLIVIDSSGSMRQYNAGGPEGFELRIGRSGKYNNIVLPESFVSSSHGRLFQDRGRFFYQDGHSSNGSYVTSSTRTKYLKGTDQVVPLSHNSVIRIGSMKDPNKRVILWFTYMAAGETVTRKDLDRDQITIGRSSGNDIVLRHPSVSRTHAVIFRQAQGYGIQDAGSTNGVLINGDRMLQQRTLQDKDVIQISGFQLVYCGRSIYYKDRISGIGITARDINKFVGSGKTSKQILHDANVEIGANEFVAIIGGSGAGKSTIMNVLNGFDRSYEGDVFFNNISLTDNFQLLKSIIGYVPQEDIIYENLTLRKMLHYTARLRMPKDVDDMEVEARIDDVLRTLELTEHQNTLIRKMSGGQKKRASIAVELLADPKLFFLDEPTSGLDPGTEKNLMTAMKKLCKEQERTIVMVTHTTQSLHLCDKVIFMGPGGRVCFVGSVDAAKQFFGNDDLTEIYNIIGADPERWERKYKASAPGFSGQSGQSDVTSYRRPKVPALSQFTTLVSRYAELMGNDRRKLLILLLEPVVIGLLLVIVAGDHIFDVFNPDMPVDPGTAPVAARAYSETKSIMFTLSCAAIWIGLFNSIQEICKERNILKREYMANLRLPVYMGSKVLVQMIIGLIQAILLSMTFLLAVGHMENDDGVKIEPAPEGLQTLFGGENAMYIEVILTVWITIITSMALGLIVSSLVKSGDKAMVVAPFLLIVQLLFSGFLFPLKGIGEKISYITVSKWSVDGLCTISNIGDIDPAIHPVQRELDDELFRWGDHGESVIHDWWILVLMAAVCIVCSTIVLRSVAKDGR